MRHSPYTARALDTASHDGFDERANILVLNGSFALCEAAPVTPKLHWLVLQTKLHSVLLVNLEKIIPKKTMSVMRTLQVYEKYIYIDIFLPEDHILHPDHRLGNLMGG